MTVKCMGIPCYGGIQSTGVVTTAIKVLHNTCNMYTCDLPDMYALGLRVYIHGIYMHANLSL